MGDRGREPWASVCAGVRRVLGRGWEVPPGPLHTGRVAASPAWAPRAGTVSSGLEFRAGRSELALHSGRKPRAPSACGP